MFKVFTKARKSVDTAWSRWVFGGPMRSRWCSLSGVWLTSAMTTRARLLPINQKSCRSRLLCSKLHRTSSLLSAPRLVSLEWNGWNKILSGTYFLNHKKMINKPVSDYRPHKSTPSFPSLSRTLTLHWEQSGESKTYSWSCPGSRSGNLYYSQHLNQASRLPKILNRATSFNTNTWLILIYPTFLNWFVAYAEESVVYSTFVWFRFWCDFKSRDGCSWESYRSCAWDCTDEISPCLTIGPWYLPQVDLRNTNWR